MTVTKRQGVWIGGHSHLDGANYPSRWWKRKQTHAFGRNFCISLFSLDWPTLSGFFFIVVYTIVSAFKEISCVVTSLIKIIVSMCEKRREHRVCSQLSVLPVVRQREGSVLNRVKSRGLHFNTQLTFKWANTTTKSKLSPQTFHNATCASLSLFGKKKWKIIALMITNY